MERGRVDNPSSIHDVAFRRQGAVVWLLIDGPADALVDPGRHGELVVVPDGTCFLGVVFLVCRGRSLMGPFSEELFAAPMNPVNLGTGVLPN